jgi:hypothetical protein
MDGRPVRVSLIAANSRRSPALDDSGNDDK